METNNPDAAGADSALHEGAPLQVSSDLTSLSQKPLVASEGLQLILPALHFFH